MPAQPKPTEPFVSKGQKQKSILELSATLLECYVLSVEMVSIIFLFVFAFQSITIRSYEGHNKTVVCIFLMPLWFKLHSNRISRRCIEFLCHILIDCNRQRTPTYQMCALNSDFDAKNATHFIHKGVELYFSSFVYAHLYYSTRKFFFGIG